MDLILSILFSTSLFVVFSIQKRFGIAPLPVIIINYITAGISGFVHLQQLPNPDNLSANWFPMALIMGAMFITSFNLMGRTTQEIGVSVAAITSKMSMVIPVGAAIFYFSEAINFLQILAILLAFVAVYLTSDKGSSPTSGSKNLLLPLFLFLGCGTVDLLINTSQKLYGTQTDFAVMTPVLFLVAGTFGSLYVVAFDRNVLRSIEWKTLIFGVFLGVFNYLSLYFMYRALSNGDWPSSVLFPLNNVGVVALSAILGVAFFGDRFSKRNLIGLAASLVALVCMML